MTDTPRKIAFTVKPDGAGGFTVLAADKPVRTPVGNALVVPHRALAQAICDELSDKPGVLAGRGLNDPAAAPYFRMAAGAIDVIAADNEARARLEADLAGYSATDLVCYRSPHPETLVARECDAWDPVCAWFKDTFGIALATTTGFGDAGQDARLEEVLKREIAALDAFRLAALSLAVHAAGSVIIGLALVRRHLDPETAFAAVTVGETFQEETWGIDKDARAARAVKRLDLDHAAGFLALLEEER